MSDQIENTPEARWRNLKERGKMFLVNIEEISDKPSWLDEERFTKARETVQKFFIGVCYSCLTGLLLILQLPDGLEPLLSTGNSKDIPALYKRYLNTIIHVNSWYEDDIFNPETKGYKSIRQVRAMHKRVQNLMNNKFKVKDMHGKERKWFNHYDVALTQFSFIGLAMLFPQKTAMILATPEELEYINYYWRVLGYMMGVKDEFNACQFDKYEDIREFNRLIFEHEFKDKFKEEPCEIGLNMTKSICVALNYFTPLVTFNSLAHWWSEQFLFNGYEPQPMNTREKLLNFWTNLSFNHLLKSEGLLKISNNLHKRRFDARLKNKDKVYEKLKEQYKDNTNYTYYSTRVDYFNKDDAKIVPLIEADVNASPAHQTKSETPDYDTNNNSDSKVYEKSMNPACPFGFTTASMPITVNESVVSA